MSEHDEGRRAFLIGARCPHGQRSQIVGGEPLRPELGHPKSLHHGGIDTLLHWRLQSDADDAGTHLHERRRDRESLPEEVWAALLVLDFRLRRFPAERETS